MHERVVLWLCRKMMEAGFAWLRAGLYPRAFGWWLARRSLDLAIGRMLKGLKDAS